MMTKPMKTLALHYLMIQFLIILYSFTSLYASSSSCDPPKNTRKGLENCSYAIRSGHSMGTSGYCSGSMAETLNYQIDEKVFIPYVVTQLKHFLHVNEEQQRQKLGLIRIRRYLLVSMEILDTLRLKNVTWVQIWSPWKRILGLQTASSHRSLNRRAWKIETKYSEDFLKWMRGNVILRSLLKKSGNCERQRVRKFASLLSMNALLLYRLRNTNL